MFLSLLAARIPFSYTLIILAFESGAPSRQENTRFSGRTLLGARTSA
jgi:hypothetical protein